MSEVSTHRQKESKVGVVLMLVNDVSQVGCLGHWRSRDRAQVRDDGFCIGVNFRVSDQRGEGGIRVELEEAGFEVLPVNKDDFLELDINTKFGARRAMSG